jgi:hypothetical protein
MLSVGFARSYFFLKEVFTHTSFVIMPSCVGDVISWICKENLLRVLHLHPVVSVAEALVISWVLALQSRCRFCTAETGSDLFAEAHIP